ncbi:MAG TPA: zinc ABC transporter substrate-binding protein [Candidatus Sulfotelmatobacter sp.]|jgi:zinc/manganese transport system substrate-binding protein|nr:zinc ABC transporter substrate-binding protein [Candidatus Sulfotelmatobacter sp.]
MFRRSLIAAAFVISAVSAGVPAMAEPLPVVASFSILGDLVSQVGGADVAVTTLVGPGSDTHVYQPVPSDAQTLAASKLVFVNGLGLEGWMERLIQASGTKATVVTVSSAVKAAQMEEDGKTVTDPHAWQNLANGRLYVRAIADALAVADPVHADGFRQRAAAVDKELADLDDWVKGEIAKVPAAKRKIITTHDAFGYFGRAYGVAFLAPVGISTEAEPTPAGIAKLARQAKAEHIKALFIENLSDPRLIQTLAKESGGTVGGELFSDSLSDAKGPAAGYQAMFRHNVPAMIEAMGKN